MKQFLQLKNLLKSILIFGIFVTGYQKTFAQCGTLANPIQLASGNINWSQVAALTACSSTLTTNNSTYNGNVYIKLVNGTNLIMDINITINGLFSIVNNGNSDFTVASGNTVTVLGDMGDDSNNNVDFTVQSNSALIVTGTLYGKNSNSLGGTGAISAGALAFGSGNGPINCASGGCPLLSISNCNQSGSVCTENGGGGNTCATNVGGTVTPNQSSCSAPFDAALLTASGFTGSILRWEYSTNGGTSWLGINNVSTTYNPPSTAQSRLYRTVILNNTNGNFCNSYSSTANVSVSTPTAAGTITGSATVCRNTTGNVYSVPPIAGATSYTWDYITGTGATINGTANTVTVDFNGSATTGTLSVRGTNSCGNGTLSSFAVTVNAAVAPTVNQPSNQVVCVGTNTTAVTFSGTGNSYNWTNNNTVVNLNASGTDNIAAFASRNSSISPFNTSSNVVTATVTVTPSNASCRGIPKTFTYTVNPNSTPSVSIVITSGSNPVCNNSSVTFTATPLNAGASPSYQWTRNGSNVVGANAQTWVATAGTDFTNGQLIRCVVTSNAPCPTMPTATSSDITMTVTSSVTPSVSLAITNGSQTMCSGASVTFTATPTNGGVSPSYNFRINTISAQNSSLNTFTSNTLANGQSVDCIITSNATCPSPATATSNSIVMTVNANVTPTISISNTQATVCSGMSFTSNITNGGSTPSYQWRKNNVDIVSATSSTYTGVALAVNDAITCVLTSNAACRTSNTATSNTINFAISGLPTTTWNGSVNNTWSVVGNWSAGVPTRDLIASIPLGTPTIASTAEAYSINISSGATLNIAASNTVSIYGNIVNDGTLSANTSTLLLIGCAGTTAISHLITSTNGNTVATFGNLTLSDAAGVTLNTNASITDDLTLSNGTFTNTNKTFTFLSTVSKTARVAPITSGLYSGNITMQRLAPGGTTGWAWLGSCINNTTLADWYNNNTEIPMSGFPGVSYASGSSNWVSVYTYNETATGTFDAAASYIVPTNATNPIVSGMGYWVYLGNGATTTTNILFDATGTFNSGNFNFPVTYTVGGSGSSQDGWNLLSNPYPSAIDWTSPSFVTTNISNSVYRFNADINNWAVFTKGTNISVNGGTKDIPSSQGFYVQATAASPSLTISENAKSNLQPTFLRTAAAQNSGILSIKVNSKSSVIADECFVRFDQNAIDEIDELDSYKFYPSAGASVNVSTKVGNEELTINSLFNLDHKFELPLKLSATNAGTYVITFSGINNLATDFVSEFSNDYLVLVDELGNETELSNVQNTQITVILTSDALTNNYTIRWHNELTSAIKTNKNLLNEVVVSEDANGLFVNFENENASNANIVIYNSLGQEIESIQLQQVSKGKHYLKLNVVAQGIYIVQVIYNGNQISKKVKL